MTGRSSQVARGLNTIAANIVANKDALKDFGIEVEGAGGQLRSTFDVLQDLSKVWDNLSDSTRVTLGTTLAGKNQYKVLASVMTNFATASEAAATALHSAGSAAEENARYMESIEARVTAVSAAFQQMSLKVVDSDMVKGILDIAKAFAELGSTNVGSAITQIVLLSGVSWGGLQLLGQSILPGIIGGFRAFTSVLRGATLEATAASLGFKSALSAGLGASLPIILAVTTAITGLVAIIKNIKEAYDEAHPSVEEALSKLEKSKTEYESVEEKYQEAKTRLDELNATPYEARTPEIQEEIAKLEVLVSLYEQAKQLRKDEVKYNASMYAKSVEIEGFKTGTSVSGMVKTGRKTSEGLAEAERFVEVYEDLETAIIAAAYAESQFNNHPIDITDIKEAQKELQKSGWVIEDNVVSLDSFKERITNFSQYISGENIDVLKNVNNLQILSKEYESLISLGQDYADALKQINYEDLTSDEQVFLMQWDSMIQNFNALNQYVEETISDVSSAIDIQTQIFLKSAGALSEYAQNLLAAKNAYELFKASMGESGDYDDSFKGLVSVFNELNGEWEKGQVGSKAFLTALELLTGQTFDAESATQYLNEHLETLQLLFGDSESGGIGLVSAMLKLQKEGSLTGASIQKIGDSLEVSVTDFSALANSLGISEGSLYSLTQALKVLGVNFDYNINGILDKLSGLGKGVVDFGDKTTVNFEEFVKQAKLAGMSTDEILMIKDVLDGASDVDLTNVAEGMGLITDDADDAAGASNDLEEGLEGVGDTASGISDTASAVDSLAGNLNKAANQATLLQRRLSELGSIDLPNFNAEGTNYAEEGNSLVNEEGPELIQSGDKAYIAGGGAPTITHLNRGDKVYTAEETKDILKGKNISSIQAHAKGSPTINTTGISGASASVSPSLLPHVSQTLSDALKNFLEGKKGNSNQTNSSSSSSKTSTSSESKTAKDIFDEWLKAKKHALAMDEITEKEYYEELEKMNEKYFKNSKEYQDEYWKYQEEVYKWRKSQLEDENKLLEKQIELEKALGELQKAKEQKILVYKNGKFQYIEDIDAISKARDEVAKISAEMGIESGYATYFTTNKSGYAKGTSNASAGLHLVGENGPELRVLNSGDGIIPSDVTRNLLSLAGYNNSKFSNGLDRIKQILYSFNIDNLSLPNVSNPTEFFDGLKNYAYQYSYAQ